MKPGSVPPDGRQAGRPVPLCGFCRESFSRQNPGALDGHAFDMADRFEPVALALPAGRAPETLPPVVAHFIAACWHGMSRVQLLDRARRLGLRVALRARPDASPDGVRLYSLVLVAGEVRAELVAHVRRLVRRRSTRRAKAPLPPPRDARRQGLFS